MRILLVSNYQPPHMGGIEFAAEALKKCWQAREHDVTWMTTDVPRRPDLQTADNRRIRALNFLENWLQINSPLVCPFTLPAIRRAIKEHDVINTHSLAPGLASLVTIMALRMGKPVVVTQHVGVIPLKPAFLDAIQHRVLCGLARWSLKKGARLTFVGEAVRDWFIEEARLPTEPICMTPAGINQEDYYFVPEEERTKLREKWKLAGHPLNILFVGRYYEKKGLPLIHKLAQALPDVHFTLVGSGPIDPAEWKLPNIQLVGFVSTEELRELYGTHDLFIMPSVGEGWPAVIPQAMACGLPCLISEETFSGYRQDADIFDVQPRNADILTARLKSYRDNPVTLLPREQVSEYSRTHWDWMQTAIIYEDLFKELLNRKPTSNIRQNH
jgi:glycosyltransferase involved in cell wall biosynthesis